MNRRLKSDIFNVALQLTLRTIFVHPFGLILTFCLPIGSMLLHVIIIRNWRNFSGSSHSICWFDRRLKIQINTINNLPLRASSCASRMEIFFFDQPHKQAYVSNKTDIVRRTLINKCFFSFISIIIIAQHKKFLMLLVCSHFLLDFIEIKYKCSAGFVEFRCCMAFFWLIFFSFCSFRSVEFLWKSSLWMHFMRLQTSSTHMKNEHEWRFFLME